MLEQGQDVGWKGRFDLLTNSSHTSVILTSEFICKCRSELPHPNEWEEVYRARV